MKKIRIVLLSLLLVTAIFFVTGCSAFKTYPTEKDVLKYLDEICPNEKTKYKVTEEKSGSGIKTYHYEFSSKERDMDFVIYATTSRETFDGAPIPFTWHKSMWDTYKDNIRLYYKEQIKEIFDKYDNELDTNKLLDRGAKNYVIDTIYLSVDSFSDMNYVALMCGELSELYKQEAEFNTEEWMEENPLFDIQLRSITSNNSNYSFSKTVIDGKKTYEEYYELLSHDYRQKVYDGFIQDSTVTDFEGLKKSELQVQVDGSDVVKSDISISNVNTWRPENFVAKYDYETKAYYLPINVTINKDCDPALLQFYLKNSDGDLKKYSRSSTKFEIDNKDYEIKTELTKNISKDILDFDIYKNGKKLKITKLDRDYNGQYVFWIDVDDMADIFNFEYKIDEESGTINLEFN